MQAVQITRLRGDNGYPPASQRGNIRYFIRHKEARPQLSLKPFTMQPQTHQPELSDRYYLDNFNCLVDYVFEHYQPLLIHDELEFYRQYSVLSEQGQRLFIRLLSRSGEYIRCSKLLYPEINNIPDTTRALVECNMLALASVDKLSEWLGVFTRKELANCLKLSTPDTDTTARLLIEPDLFGSRPLDQLTRSEQVVQVRHQHAFITFRLLFFGNLHQDLSTFVLRDLGLRTFENYLTDNSTLPFQSRNQIEAYLQYYRCADLYEQAQASGADALVALSKTLPEIAGSNDATLKRRVERFLNRIARELERFDYLKDAATLYRKNSHPPARERLARIEAKLGNEEAAFELCNEIEKTAIDAEEKEFSQFFAARLAGKIGRHYQQPVKHTPEQITLTVPASNLPVEFSAALHFAKTGKCFYVENSLISGVFGLAIWDILFAPIDGVFYHPFQSAPTDLYDPEFYQQRENLFDARFSEIRNGQLLNIVLTHFHAKYGLRNPLVHWHHLDRYLLTLACKTIPGDHWIYYFNYLLKDIRNNRSGLPDLIYFPDNGEYTLLEVKGPGDRLQKNQLRWMQYFSEHEIHHAVVQVNFSEQTSPASDLPNLTGTTQRGG